MNTLIRFFDSGTCIITIYLYYDSNYVLKDVINWLESHDSGPILFIISAFRLYLRNKYHEYMYLHEPYNIQNKKKDMSYKYADRPVGYIIDIGKHMNRLLVKLVHIETQKEIIDVPIKLRCRFNL